MNVRELARVAGIGASVVTVLVLVAPYVVIAEQQDLILAYYAAGPIGAGGVGLFALLSAVVFASIERGNVDPGTLAGVVVVLGVSTVLLAVVWELSIDPTVRFGFPATYRWIEWHSLAVIAAAIPIPVCAGLYARELLE
ncbi:DUF7548 family protein [Halorubrum sp. DTA98]|uniref:DUF7548 family protein n=1 Tax=Halorubrum sp. DTA98 TaxID=3402163 RepID=UPI003AAFF021